MDDLTHCSTVPGSSSAKTRMLSSVPPSNGVCGAIAIFTLASVEGKYRLELRWLITALLLLPLLLLAAMLSSFIGGGNTGPPPTAEEAKEQQDAAGATTEGAVEQQMLVADGAAVEQTVETLKDSIQQLLDLCAE